MKIAIKTLGCRLNQAESDKIAEKLANFGVEVDYLFKNKSNLYIINTCCITEKAVTKSRQIINNIRNKHKKTIIIGCGCAKDIKDEVDLFVEDKNKISKEIYNKFIKNNKFDQSNTNKLPKHSYTRAFIKIQDGCNNFCTYCIIPYVRQKMISISYNKIINEIKRKEEQGFKEIVLTGVNIGKYKNKKIDLVELVKRILKNTKIHRIRFGSINPDHVSNGFISLFKNKRACRHLHLSLQSGSDSVLERMNRNYNTKDYLNIINKINSEYTDFNFTTDIIVGFPGETREEFIETCEFAERVGFSKIHIFPYSKRKGTVAYKMHNQLDYSKKKKRTIVLKEINKVLEENFKRKMLGKREEILFENRKDNCYSGFTKNYFKVKLNSKENLRNKIKVIKILKSNLTI